MDGTPDFDRELVGMYAAALLPTYDATVPEDVSNVWLRRRIVDYARRAQIKALYLRSQER